MGAAGADRLGAQLENIGGMLYARGWMLIGTHKNQDYALFFRQPIPKVLPKMRR